MGIESIDPSFPTRLRHGVDFREDFTCGLNASNEVGEKRWTIQAIGGSQVPNFQSAAAGRFGVTRNRTSGVASQGTVLGQSSVLHLPAVRPATFTFETSIAIPAGTDDEVEHWVGFATDSTSDAKVATATNFVGVRYLAAAAGSQDWIGVVKDGAASETLTTLITDAGAFMHFKFVRTGTGIQWYVNDVATGAVVTTTIPAAGLSAVIGSLETAASGGSQKQLDIDYFQYYATGLER